jgi:hypothetical protein
MGLSKRLGVRQDTYTIEGSMFTWKDSNCHIGSHSLLVFICMQYSSSWESYILDRNKGGGLSSSLHGPRKYRSLTPLSQLETKRCLGVEDWQLIVQIREQDFCEQLVKPTMLDPNKIDFLHHSVIISHLTDAWTFLYLRIFALSLFWGVHVSVYACILKGIDVRDM